MELPPPAKYANIAFALVYFLIMVMVDYTWGNFLMNFASNYGGEEGVIIQLMITVVLMFATFIMPILIYNGIVTNFFNVFLGIGQMLIGIPIIIFCVQILTFMIETLHLVGDTLIVATFLQIMCIAIFGFITPLLIMLQEESVVPIDMGGE